MSWLTWNCLFRVCFHCQTCSVINTFVLFLCCVKRVNFSTFHTFWVRRQVSNFVTSSWNQMMKDQQRKILYWRTTKYFKGSGRDFIKTNMKNYKSRNGSWKPHQTKTRTKQQLLNLIQINICQGYWTGR